MDVLRNGDEALAAICTTPFDAVVMDIMLAGRDGLSVLRQARGRGNGTAEIEITNTGEGIRPELQPRVFERFVRGDEARCRAIEGCGLGLTICRWIVQSHGGTIQLMSDATKRTTATVRLPLV